MAITTAGGSGSGTYTLASMGSANISLFTTPNTSNAIFIVTIMVSGQCKTSSTTTIVDTTPATFTHRCIVGPNTAVVLPLFNPGGGSDTYAYSYNWCSIVFS